MPSTARFAERIGKVFLPEADDVDAGSDFTPNPEGPELPPGIPGLPGELPHVPVKWPRREVLPLTKEFWWPKFCFTALKPGCYSIGFTPVGTSIFGTRYHGTVRIEPFEHRIRMSGDLYSYRLFDDIVLHTKLEVLRVYGPIHDSGATGDAGGGEAADTGGVIPIYPRRAYRSYLNGTSARLFSLVTKGTECSFSLSFDEFVYNHPATGFSGSFNSSPTRSIHYVLRSTATPDLYTGEAYQGTTLIGTVSIRWISDRFRRAHLQLNTLAGAESPPPSVGAATFASIFGDAGWDVSFTDGGTVPLPGALAGLNTTQCWSSANLHTLMTSVPGYNPADLDSLWRVHLVAVPAQLGCSRGIMFDSAGSDPNSVRREGSATFSRDGYPAAEVPDGAGGSHYDGAAGQQQRNVPRAFLRSATHEVGHAFNQIHQNFELGIDNSIMSPTPSVATVIGLGGTFPDAIALAFNPTVTRHLRHLPDPAVRPGAMDFFGSAVSAPEASDVAWPATLEVSLAASSESVSLGEPIVLKYALSNHGTSPIPVPATLDVSSLTVRINVTDPTGRITFMRPYSLDSCPKLTLVELQPGKSIAGEALLFWGRDGFAFETPGRHVVEVIILWNVAGVPVAASGTAAVFVGYPVSTTDNEVAALLLDPEVGKAIASERAWAFELGAERIKQATKTKATHPAARAIARFAVLTAPKQTTARKPASPRRSQKSAST